MPRCRPPPASPPGAPASRSPGSAAAIRWVGEDAPRLVARSGQVRIRSGQRSHERPMNDASHAARHNRAAEELCQAALKGAQMLHQHCNVNAIPRPRTASINGTAGLPGSRCDRASYSQNPVTANSLRLVAGVRYLVGVVHCFHQPLQVAAVLPIIQSSRHRISDL